VKVKLLAPVDRVGGGGAAGDVLDLPDNEAKGLIDRGMAVKASKPKRTKPKKVEE